MALGNAIPEAGTQNLYRVLHNNGSVVEVVAMYDLATMGFDEVDSTGIYAGKSLDVYLHTTWYNTLSSTAKLAIVGKTFTQDCWYNNADGSPTYALHTYHGVNLHNISLNTATYSNSITRYVYALSIQDVISYITDTTIGDGKLEYYNIWKMFWNTINEPTTAVNFWLRSAWGGYPYYAWYISPADGGFGSSYAYYTGYNARPTFQIDLSKIPWQFAS